MLIRSAAIPRRAYLLPLLRVSPLPIAHAPGRHCEPIAIPHPVAPGISGRPFGSGLRGFLGLAAAILASAATLARQVMPTRLLGPTPLPPRDSTTRSSRSWPTTAPVATATGSRKGASALDGFESDDAMLARRDLWNNVLKNVRAGLMPPSDKPRPTAEEIKTLEDWIKRDAFRLDPSQPRPRSRHAPPPEPGRVPQHDPRPDGDRLPRR